MCHILCPQVSAIRLDMRRAHPHAVLVVHGQVVNYLCLAELLQLHDVVPAGQVAGRQAGSVLIRCMHASHTTKGFLATLQAMESMRAAVAVTET